MKAITSKAEATRRDTERQAVKRRAAGVQERAVYLDGVHSRQAEIKSLKAEGVAVKEISRRLGVPRSTVYNALKTGAV